MNQIVIRKSPTADTRTCDFTKVTKDQLFSSSVQHIADVRKGLELFRHLLWSAAENHDWSKLKQIDQFHEDFITGFKKTTWWDNHRKVERHHLAQSDGVRPNVNLIDVLEYITDCVMAGKARSGTVYGIQIEPDVLMKAFVNTCTLLIDSVEVAEDEK